MNTINLILDLYVIVLLLFTITGLTKGYYHMDYLKEILPNEYSKFKNYFDVFTLKSYNTKLQFLFLPFFFRNKKNENKRAKQIAKTINIILIANLLLLLILISPIIYSIFIL